MNALIIAKIAKKDQRILNQIKVGMVLTVEDQISAMLDTSAKIYSHQNWISKSSPGIIITPLVTKAKNSTVFSLFQYFL
jgi:hypothetical protein